MDISTKLSNNASKNDDCGFILTRQSRELANRCFLEYWLLSPSGPVKLVTPAQKEVFFIRQTDSVQAKAALTKSRIIYSAKSLALKTFEHETTCALYFNKRSAAFKAKELLHNNGITCYEDDIRLADRFLMERFIYGNARFSGAASPPSAHPTPSPTSATSALSTIDTTKIQEKPYRCFNDAQLIPNNKTVSTPSFKILSIDIECSEHGELYSIGLAAADYECILMIGEQQHSSPSWLTWVTDEKHLLHEFIREVSAYDPDIFIGWNVVNFDFRLMLKRAAMHNIRLTLGRGNEAVFWRDARDEVDQGYISMPGRVVIDGIDALKTATYHFDSFSLEFVSQSLLGKGKKTDDVENRMASITHDFKHNKLKLAEYNRQDCILVLEIFAHTKLLDFLTLRSQLTGLELDRVGGSVAAFINLYQPKLHRAGYIAPNRPEDGGLASPGGYVMDSQPGLYRNVLVLDFKSLYPSIIRTFKIDPLGLIEGLRSPENAIPGYKGAFFSRDQHFLPDIITSLWRQRDEAKANKDSARSQALKILMNSFYGVLGSGGCPFYDTRLASSITMRGHDIMQTTAQWITESGYQVIYGDTDSTFVWLEGDIDSHQAQAIGQSLQKDINTRWTALIQDEYALNNHLEIEFETHFSRFLMPTIRGSSLGSKKRYAGIKETDDGNELIFKGLETVRSDWTLLAKTFQYTLYSMIFSEHDVRDYIRKVITDTRAGLYDEHLVYRKRLRRRLDHYVKNIPPHVKAARMADAINNNNGKQLRYQHKGWISYLITLNGPQAIEHCTIGIDYDHYVDKQIRPIAEGILPFIGLSFEAITADQLGLFK